MDRPIEYLLILVHELCRLTGETEWVEFKANARKPAEVGEYISALPNSAALIGNAIAHFGVGISDQDPLVSGPLAPLRVSVTSFR